MSQKSMNEYYSALERLIKDEPINLEKGTKINFDTVALEAGRGRGAIKGDSEEIRNLKLKINEAQTLKKKKNSAKEIAKETKDWKAKYLKIKEKYENLEREQKIQAEQLVSVIFQLAETKKELTNFMSKNDNLIRFNKNN
ncbi:hypothetical protein F935_03453 [Acinetobacter calcoaceticus ANC 3811]|uniref:Uncharacterized protein n=2 Tax=Acinetobacter TaxID=469 RepID=R8Y0M6_ACICA|nr:hypothetical protein [Acinetobacter calcoaceticus]EOQ61107.1 hypothetical protein F935_03453 [Acinetobacter calcoaceticus ANC 3811]KHN67955.1 hypothetical protein DH17_09485 [Acinetobacter oleivorans]KUM13830.1 hypothetical protein AV645_12840 [Acinetobacter calcoaceticus]